MNDELMFDYLLNMGAMRPEQDEIKRKQAMVDALRGNAMTPQKGQMVSGHYVPQGLAGAVSQLGQGYLAKRGQEGVDARMGQMNNSQAQMLRDLRMQAERKRREQLGNAPGGAGFGADLGME